MDALAARCAALLDDQRPDWFWNSIEYRIRRSPVWLDRLSQPTTYLKELDKATAEQIRLHVSSTHERARAAAIKRGWEGF